VGLKARAFSDFYVSLVNGQTGTDEKKRRRKKVLNLWDLRNNDKRELADFLVRNKKLLGFRKCAKVWHEITIGALKNDGGHPTKATTTKRREISRNNARIFQDQLVKTHTPTTEDDVRILKTGPDG